MTHASLTNELGCHVPPFLPPISMLLVVMGPQCPPPPFLVCLVSLAICRLLAKKPRIRDEGVMSRGIRIIGGVELSNVSGKKVSTNQPFIY